MPRTRARSLITCGVCFALCWAAASAFATPVAVNPNLQLRLVLNTPAGVPTVRIAKDPRNNQLYFLKANGDIYSVNLLNSTSTKVYGSADHGLNGSELGMAIGPDGTIYLEGDFLTADGKHGYARIMKGVPNNSGVRVWSQLAQTDNWPLSGGAYDHNDSALIVSPDGQYLLLNAGSRTDHGEVESNGGAFPNTRDVALTAKIFQLPTSGNNLFLTNDLPTLLSQGYVFVQGTRNAFDFAYGPNGDLFATENGPDRDMSDSLYWLRAGSHYGFPWRLGGADNPQQFSNYNPANDPLLNPVFGAVSAGLYYNDPAFPPPPTNFTDPVINYGPNADVYRNPANGAFIDASQTGTSLTSFTAHSSPLGLVFDNAGAMAAPFMHDGFVLRWTPGDPTGDTLAGPYYDASQDLLDLKLTKLGTTNYGMSATTLVSGFANPMDSEIIGNKIYVVEYGGSQGLWEITFPSSQPADPWSGTWVGAYVSNNAACGITNTGNISLTFQVANGVVTGSGIQDGVVCADGNCAVHGFGTFSGPLTGSVAGSSINFTGNWLNSCSGQTSPMNFQGTLDAGTLTGPGNIALHKLGVANECVLDWNSTYQLIDGFGGSSAFIGGWNEPWADLFFSTNNGIGLSLLRSRIASDGTTQDGYIMQLAQARGARVWCAPWTPPGAYKDTGSLDGGRFLSTYNQPYASLLANAVLSIKTNYNVDLYALSVQNEPDVTTTLYESCVWTSQQFHDFVPYLYQALASNGLASTKIMISEQAIWNFGLTVDSMNDPATVGAVGIVAGHGYDFSITPVYTAGKPLWETEVSFLGGNDSSIGNGIFWADEIHAMMTVAQVNAFHYWWLIPQGVDNQGLTDITGVPAKRFYALGQFSRFIRPGYYRMGAFNNGAVATSAYKDPASGNFAIVAVNSNTVPITQTFDVANFTAGSVTPWITDVSRSLVVQTAIPVANASFSYVLPPMSVATFVGQTNLNVTFLTQPQSQSANIGENVSFSVSVSGATPLTYTWLQNGTAVPGASNATLSLAHAAASSSGSQFACVVSNVYGAITSSVANLTVSAPVCVEPPPGIVAWWPGENSAADVIGGNNGTLMGGVIITNAQVGQGFLFNGTNSYVQFPPNLFPLPNAAPFSIELWFETTNGGVILEQQAAVPFGYPGGGWIPNMYVGTDGNLYVQLFWNGGLNQISTTQPVNDGVFHHLAVTYDGVNEVVYLDGAVLGIKRMAFSTYANYFSCQLGIGYTQFWPYGNGGWYAFNGIIDEPTLYTNALTTAQMKSLYHAGSAGKCTDGMLPLITTQPTNQTVLAGDPSAFTVGATSLLPLSYEWLRGNSPLAGATSATLSLTNAQTQNAGNYSVIVSTALGSVTSSVVSLTVSNPPLVCVPPPPGAFAWWPGEGNAVDIVNGYNGALVNGVGFTNGLVGTGFAFDGGTGYVQLPPNLFPLPNAQAFSIELWFATAAGGVILEQQSGAPFGSPTAWVPDMYVGTDGKLYVQLFWDGAFNQIVTSQPVNDGVFHHLAVTYDGASEVVFLDGVQVGSRALAYSTYANNFACQLGTGYTQFWPAGNGGWFAFTGIIDEPTFYSSALTAAQVRSIYHAGAAGKCVDTMQRPVIVSQPAGQTVAAGSLASLTVGVTGMLPLAYQWFHDSTVLPAATNATLTLPSVQVQDGGSYTVVVTNSAGSATSLGATLIVAVPPVVTVQPSSATGFGGTTASFAVSATSAAPLTYQWQLNGTNLANAGRLNGVTTAALTITNLQSADAGNYSVIISNIAGSVSSSNALLTVSNLNTTPYVTSAALGTLRRDYSGFVGMKIVVSSVPLTVTALGRMTAIGNSGAHLLKLVNVADGSDVPGGSISIVMGAVAPGQFQYATLPIPVTLLPGASYYLVSQETLLGDFWYDYDTTVATTAAAAHNGAFWGVTPGQWNAAYPVATPNQTFVPVDFKYASTPPPPAPPSITTQPSSQTDPPGSTATFTVTASSDSTLTYQWQLSGANLANAGTVSGVDTATLTITNLQSSDAGNYSVIVSNAIGAVTSSNALLTVSAISNSGPAKFVTGVALGTLRRDYSGYVGMKIVVGAAPLTVNSLGRLTAIGNNGTHTVKLVNGVDGSDVPGGSVSIIMGAATVGQFQYAKLANPVTLLGGASYYVVSQETQNADYWYDYDTTITTTPVAAHNGAFWGVVPGQWNAAYPAATPSQTFVPVDFTYTTNPPPPPSPEAPYVTSVSIGTLRHDYSGYVGMKFVVGGSSMTVTALGRMMLNGNNGAHTLKLVNVSDGTDVPGGAASLTMNGTPGQFQYFTLNNPVTLTAGAAYYLVSLEVKGGDFWYDDDTTVTTSGVATHVGAVWGYGPGQWFPPNPAGPATQTYIPLDFKCSTP